MNIIHNVLYQCIKMKHQTGMESIIVAVVAQIFKNLGNSMGNPGYCVLEARFILYSIHI